MAKKKRLAPAIISLTDEGAALAQRINQAFDDQGELWVHAGSGGFLEGVGREDPVKAAAEGQTFIFRKLKDVLGEIWEERRLLIFVMATGIVVREIAPLLKGKDQDPAVLVLDEKGKFVIPLLSGHLGGANAWAKYLAAALSAEPVITTATDGRGLTAPDEWAGKLGWKVFHLEHLPALNGKLLKVGHLNGWSEHLLPSHHRLRQDPAYSFDQSGSEEDADFIISIHPEKYMTKVCLVPPLLSIGIGSRKGVSGEHVLAGITEALTIIQSVPEAAANLASIDIKAREPGLLEAAETLGVPLRIFDAGEIEAVNRTENLTASEFVQQKIGVNGVCEAASLLGSNRGEIILGKIKRPGLTLAVSKAKYIL